MVRILLLFILAFPGCALFTEYIEVPYPVREPCLDGFPVEPVYPLAAFLNKSATAKALQSGNEWMGLDPVTETLYMQKGYIKALKTSARPCLK